ncbi:unnamed protein product [Rangifer tarandus platyrhynchus]|uniref:Uncharacterized protein n=2 Tax=Rangifer tarandus platyrhynchus TaxID=3082113 RepID=A0AC59Y4Q6_RANTA|nr:unnamed protein product [Rangifer tarandus platyrhynchus]
MLSNSDGDHRCPRWRINSKMRGLCWVLSFLSNQLLVNCVSSFASETSVKIAYLRFIGSIALISRPKTLNICVTLLNKVFKIYIHPMGLCSDVFMVGTSFCGG